MKKIMSLIFTICLSVYAIADAGSDTSKVAPAVANVNITIKDSTKTENQQPVSCEFCGKEVKGMEWWLVFAPFILLIIGWFLINSKIVGFSLTEALSEPDLGTKIIRNELYTDANLQALKDNPAMTSLLTPTIEISDDRYAKSSSRYIALITSMISWIIGTCLCAYYIYLYILTGKAPELNKLTDVVLTLGIGVVPYAFNKISAAIKK